MTGENNFIIDIESPVSYKNQVKADLAQLVELLICNQWVGGSSPSVGTIKKSLPKRRLFFMVLIFLGLEPKRARTDRKHRCSGVFIVNGKSLLPSKQTFVMCARHTNRTPQAPQPALQKKFCRFNQSRKIFSRFKLIFKHFYTILKTDI